MAKKRPRKFKKRLKALEAKSGPRRYNLTEEQVAALEKLRNKKRPMAKIETQHPGYLGSQDTYYVGNIKRYWTNLSTNFY